MLIALWPALLRHIEHPKDETIAADTSEQKKRLAIHLATKAREKKENGSSVILATPEAFVAGEGSTGINGKPNAGNNVLIDGAGLRINNQITRTPDTAIPDNDIAEYEPDTSLKEKIEMKKRNDEAFMLILLGSV